ncbi:PAC2 family protein [Cutibacterium sp. WCA-380-WT-3A]|uniref:PAC2 family protein n=1 Tax=Cutibacterium porci TaxID=2605781 RepID=A0A7K0J6I2_9ACTN|nr:PAC2 family protein [Cutibacterium porci]MSS45557.1 PAC2 family protein [Cutibacterium porci]
MDRQSNSFTWHPGIVGPDQEVSALITLVQSFGDTGLVQARVRDAIFSQLPHHELGEFDIDLLLDHRDSRQPIIFDTDHFEGYKPPRLVLHEVTDQFGQAFLVLDGPEPALGWESLVSSLTSLVDSLKIRLTVITDSIPIPTPHTRPAMVTRWASRPELILGTTSPFGRIQVPASFPVVLGQRLGETHHAVIGLASHVPHYLADLDYPESARALVEALRGATGLALPIDSLAVAANTVRAEIDTQVNNSEELKAMLRALEEQYDSRIAQRELGTTQVAVPNAEDIGAEVEDFLRSIDDSPNDASDADAQGSAPRRSSDENTDDAKPDYRPRRGGDTDD